MLAARKPPPAVPQAEQRVQLLDELLRETPPPQRADRDRMARGRLGRDLQNRKRDVEPAPDVDKAVIAPSEAYVSGRAQFFDQPVLEHQGAELRAGGSVVDDRGVGGPRRLGRGGSEVRARPVADRDRLADVQGCPGPIAEQVYAGVARQPAEVDLGSPQTGHGAPTGWRTPSGTPGCQQRDGVSDREGICAQTRKQGAQHSRAGLGVRQRAMRQLHLDPEGVSERAQAPHSLQRKHRSRERGRAQHRWRRPLEPDPLEALAQNPAIERGVVSHHHATVQTRAQGRQDLLERRR